MNKLEKNTLVNGFILKQKQFVKDINSDVFIYEHKKTGANLIHIKNDDRNKTFAIGFKTPPTDSTGVMHILEHSVLCGSAKFPTKEPFVELCKGSLNTFLNAMTYSDKTVYPISSMNDKDFFNLMHVYLDAVFYPNIYENDKILKQEGWHYHIENKGDDIDYKGVVYNEMKGVYSSPINRMYRLVEETLYPDNNYAYESGGDPVCIPNLTYDQFINTHKTLYHPSNAYISLYGNMDVKKVMKFIDDEYLSKFDKQNIDVNIDLQKPFKEKREFEYEYSVSDESQLDNETYVSLNLSVGDVKDTKLSMGMSILMNLLIYSEEAPLKQAILNEGLGDDVFCIHDPEVLQPYVSIIVKGSSKDKKDEILNVIKSTLEELSDRGISRDLIEGCINVTEFNYRELEEAVSSKGLHYSLTAIGGWIHNVNPIKMLEFEENLNDIKKLSNNRYFENLIEKYLLNNNHSSVVVLEPKLNLIQQEECKLKDKLQNYKESLSENGLNDLIKETNELLKYQEREDSEEDLNKIPLLSIEDIEKEVESLNVDVYEVDNTKLIHYNAFTGGINYISAMFDVRGVKEEDVNYIGLLSDLLTRVGTKDKTYIELSNEIMKNTGDVGFYTREFANIEDIEQYMPMLDANVKVLSNKTKDAMDIVIDVINNTSFEDEKRIREIIAEKISDMSMSLLSNGDSIAVSRMNSYYSSVSKYTQKVHGLDYLKFLKEIYSNIDSNMSFIKSKLYEVKDVIFNKNNLTISLIGDEKDLGLVKDAIMDLNAKLNNSIVELNKYSFKKEKLNEGLLIPSEVQYVAKGFNYKNLGYEYSGSMEVMKNNLRYGYLWNKIRVQGGAYGARFNMNEFGYLTLCSYRDPNLRETIKVYESIATYVENIELSDRELEKSIIGAISSMQLPTSVKGKGNIAISNYMNNKTTEFRQKQRDEVLNTTVDSLRKLAPIFKDMVKEDYHVVVGNDKINENKDLFKNIYSPLE